MCSRDVLSFHFIEAWIRDISSKWCGRTCEIDHATQSRQSLTVDRWMAWCSWKR